MEYKFSFKTEEEKEQIIKDNINLTLIKIALHLGESYLVFTDEEVIYDLTENEILGNKISILEAENADLLLDSAIKDSKISTLENDLADLTLEIAMMEVR